MREKIKNGRHASPYRLRKQLPEPVLPKSFTCTFVISVRPAGPMATLRPCPVPTCDIEAGLPGRAPALMTPHHVGRVNPPAKPEFVIGRLIGRTFGQS